MEPTAKGSKRKALEAWQKAEKKWAKEEKVTDDIERRFAETVSHGYSILAQNRRTARRVPNKFVAPLPHLSTYLNQFRFEAEVFESSSELRKQAEPHACKCGGKFYGQDKHGKPICKACLHCNRHEVPPGGNAFLHVVLKLHILFNPTCRAALCLREVFQCC
jgi:hypothetical protein